MTELRTARLRLLSFTPADAADHLTLYRDPEVTRWLRAGPFLGAYAEERSREALARFGRHWAERGFGVYAVRDAATGRFLGQCGLNTIEELGEVEVLYAFERAAWGQGLATEAARAALAHGFDTVGLTRIIAVTRPDHTASRRVMEKLGMRYERDREVFGLRVAYYALDRGPISTS
jgi:RimJ/RimL family protein N-acetyltransferase